MRPHKNMRLTTLSLPKSMGPRKGVCVACGKSGVLYYPHKYCQVCAEAAAAKYEVDQAKERRRTRFLDLRFSGVLNDHTLDVSFKDANPSPEENQRAWKSGRVWDARGNWLLYGPPGTGKTYLARCMLRKAFCVGHSVGDVSARHAIRIGCGFNLPDVWHQWCKVSALLLDDVDKIRPTEAGIGALWELLDRRMRNSGVTIVTSNIAPKQFAALLRDRVSENISLGEAALDRLKPLTVFELTGQSLRPAKRGPSSAVSVQDFVGGLVKEKGSES